MISTCSVQVVEASQQPAQLQATTRATATNPRKWNSNVMGATRPRQRPLIALQSRYVHDEVKEITLNDPSGNINALGTTGEAITSSAVDGGHNTNQLVPWNKERKTLNHVVSSCLTIAIWGLLAHQLFFTSSATLSSSLLLGVSYRTWLYISILCYLIEAYMCSTRRYLSNMLSPTQLLDTLGSLQNTPPTITWKVECYHYNHKGHHYYTKGGQKYVGDESNKVVTHRASKKFQFNK